MAKLIGAKVYNNANISIANGSHTVLTFNSELWDDEAIHSTVANTDRLTCVTAGRYVLSGCVQFAAHATGQRRLRIVEGGVAYIAAERLDTAASGETELSITTEWDMEVGDYFLLEAYQSSGGALNVVYTAAVSPYFSMHRIG